MHKIAPLIPLEWFSLDGPCSPVKTRVMSTGTLEINLGAITRNWKRLEKMTRAETAAMVKANAYGLGAAKIGPTLAKAGARTFFVATSNEGVGLRQALGEGPNIYVLSGHMRGASEEIRDAHLMPVINSAEQLVRHLENAAEVPFAVQLDTGMNRLGMEIAEWAAVRDLIDGQPLNLMVSHLACADEPDHEMNARQLRTFMHMTKGRDVPRSLANTGGVLLGDHYHFNMVRPGIGVYGGLPFADAEPVVKLDIPVIQCRDVAPGETVGYGITWTALHQSRIATLAAGYADGLLRSASNKGAVYCNGQRCPIVGRISMDLIGVDVTHLEEDPETASILGDEQSIDTLADAAGTIGYEILTSISERYNRRYVTV